MMEARRVAIVTGANGAVGLAICKGLATDPSVAGITGKYFASRRRQSCELARDEKANARLEEICLRF